MSFALAALTRNQVNPWELDSEILEEGYITEGLKSKRIESGVKILILNKIARSRILKLLHKFKI